MFDCFDTKIQVEEIYKNDEVIENESFEFDFEFTGDCLDMTQLCPSNLPF